MKQNCKRCNKVIDLNASQIRSRQLHNLHECLCSGCFRNIKNVFSKILTPDAWYMGTKYRPFTWEIFQKNRQALQNSTKLYVRVRCRYCGKEDLRRIDKIVNSKYTNNIEICNDCIMSYVTNHEQWRNINSKAQVIAQNRTEVKLKQRQAFEILQRKDRFFALKRSFNNTKTLRGFYRGIYFASSYELSFLYQHQAEQVSYCTLLIPYIKNGILHYYTPDFVINDTIFEIKGSIHNAETKIKLSAAYSYAALHNITYKVIDKTQLQAFFTNEASLQQFSYKDLLITSFPKTWKAESSKFYIDNHPFVKQLIKYLLNIKEKDRALEQLRFYLKKIKYKDFWQFYHATIHTHSFIKHYILYHGMEEKIWKDLSVVY